LQVLSSSDPVGAIIDIYRQKDNVILSRLAVIQVTYVLYSLLLAMFFFHCLLVTFEYNCFWIAACSVS
jgi:hypothetical protein